MTTFLFCECPECDWTIVVATPIDPEEKIRCVNCETDNFHTSVMTQREATDQDQAKGFDARKNYVIDPPPPPPAPKIPPAPPK